MDIASRLEALREELRREHLSAFIFPTSDPHNSEYTADHWKGREWISGFDGSAGTAVVTLTSAALWTDSRYFIAAAEKLKGTEYQLMRMNVDGTPTIAEWLSGELFSPSLLLADSTEVGIDGMTATANAVKELASDLRRRGGLTLRTNFDPLRRIWKDRPALPERPVVVQPFELTGEDVPSKLSRIRQALREQHADGMLMAALDDIAWTLNLRGDDVHCNPVFVAYLLISTTQATLYINKVKLTDEAQAQLRRSQVEVADYDDVAQGLRDYFEYNILIDPDEVNYTLYQVVRHKKLWGQEAESRIVEATSPLPAMKAIKTRAEQEGFRRAMARDGAAMVSWLRWIDQWAAEQRSAEPQSHQAETECSVAARLEALRAEQPLYRGPSFDTIAGYEEHGAIVHYEATAETASTLRPEGLLLVDSGAQYQDGTTDVTRTIALGPLTDEQRRVYTLVLKGHIDLQLLRFPDGASGTQLDAIARRPLWQAGLNYLHGTGHGVGSFLNVHEGPHQIRMEWKPARLRAGMTVTDEPGIYLEGRFGVRIENVLLVVPDGETECGRFLRFETLTLCPIDKRPIINELLTDEERKWLNDYHARVYEHLAPLTDKECREWLLHATSPLQPPASV